MSNSRFKNTYYNLVSTIGLKIITLIIRFGSRTVFIYTLGKSYLGISSLFTNILSVLSLTELGVGTAMVYSMYQPLAQKNYQKISALTNYYKILYRRICLLIFGIGILLIPFLPFLIKLDNAVEHIYIYYVLYLLNTCISYLYMYKTSVLIADQKEYIFNKCKIYFDVALTVLQCIILFALNNFLLYLMLQIVFNYTTNAYVASKVKKLYPLDEYKDCSINNCEKKDIWKNITSLLSYKIGGVVLNNTDQLFVSAMISTEMVGIYSNYLLIVNSVSAITSSLFSSAKASIGNLSVEKDEKKELFVFDILNIIFFWVYGLCSISFVVLFNDFISLWLGEEFIVSHFTVIIISLSFYFTGLLYPIWCYRETVGLFKYTKYILLITSVINLVLSYLLGKKMGLAGILGATIIARLLTNIWFEPKMLYSYYFKKSVFGYYLKQILNIVVVSIDYIICFYLCHLLILSNKIMDLLKNSLVTIVVTIIVFAIYSYLSKDWNLIKEFVQKYKKRRKV